MAAAVGRWFYFIDQGYVPEHVGEG
jgi:hypothetical protein